MTVDHDRDGYREALRWFLATLERRLEPPATFDDDAALWCAALVFRAQRLLLNGLHLTDRDGPDEGVGLLARAAYESAIVGAWLLGNSSRLNQLLGDLTQSHEVAVREAWPDGHPPAVIAAILDHHREHYPPSKLPPLKQIVDQVAAWVSESEPVLVHRLVKDREHITSEPVPHSGEPFRSSYSVYRTLSTYEVHGAGTVQHWIDLQGRTLRSDIAGRPVAEPTEVLVLVGAMVAHVASRLLGHRPLRRGSFDRRSEDHLEWEARTMRLRAAANAITENDPSEWDEFVAWFDP
jgi:hypothetical protein